MYKHLSLTFIIFFYLGMTPFQSPINMKLKEANEKMLCGKWRIVWAETCDRCPLYTPADTVIIEFFSNYTCNGYLSRDIKVFQAKWTLYNEQQIYLEIINNNQKLNYQITQLDSTALFLSSLSKTRSFEIFYNKLKYE